jgi:hypothetical protein
MKSEVDWTAALDRRAGPPRWTAALDRRAGPPRWTADFFELKLYSDSVLKWRQSVIEYKSKIFSRSAVSD